MDNEIKHKLLIFLRYFLVVLILISSYFLLRVTNNKFIESTNNLSDFINTIESKTFDLRQNMIYSNKKASKDIVILAIDDASHEYILDTYGEWPIPRYVHADVINYIEKYNPSIIAFDLMFVKSKKSVEADDQRLADAISKNDNVFVAINFDDNQIRKPVKLENKLKAQVINNSDINLKNEDERYTNCRMILDQIVQKTDNIGQINLSRDADGLIRKVPAFVNYDNDLYPYLALKVALKHLSKTENVYKNEFIIDKNRNLLISDKRKIPLSRKGEIILNWYGPSGANEEAKVKTFKHVPLALILKTIRNEKIEKVYTNKYGKFDPEKDFKDKIIYIGTTAMSMFDIKSVPTEEVLPGVEVHATLINNLIDNSFIKKTDDFIDYSIAIILAFIVAICLLKFNSTAVSVSTSIGIVLIYIVIATLLMLYFNIWIGIVIPISSIIIIFTAVYILKYLVTSKDLEHTYKLATTDGLTGLYNHRYFQEQMRLNLETAKRYNTFCSLILIDIDFFKKFNDTYGHQAGDAVLRHVASTLKKNVRGTDIVCRYGGEEMSIILSNTSNEEALATAQKICDIIASTTFKLEANPECHVTISLGVATYPQNGQTPQELIEYSDQCLYKAKENGRNQVGKLD